MVGRVGPVLRFDGQTLIEPATGALTVAPVIDLHPGLGGGNRHGDAASAFQPQHRAQGLRAVGQAEIVVVGVGAGGDRAHLAQVEDQAVHGGNFAGRAEIRRDGQVAVGGDAQGMAVPCRRAVHVPIGMVGDVEQGQRVGGGGDIHAQSAVQDGEGRGDRAVAGHVALTGGQVDGQGDRGIAGLGNGPDLVAGAGGTEVQGVATGLIGLKLEGLAADGGAGVGQTVDDRGDQCAMVQHAAFVIRQQVGTERQVMGHAFEADGLQRGTPGQDRGGKVAVGDGDLVDDLTRRRRAEFRDLRHVRPPAGFARK